MALNLRVKLQGLSPEDNLRINLSELWEAPFQQEPSHSKSWGSAVMAEPLSKLSACMMWAPSERVKCRNLTGRVFPKLVRARNEGQLCFSSVIYYPRTIGAVKQVGCKHHYFQSVEGRDIFLSAHLSGHLTLWSYIASPFSQCILGNLAFKPLVKSWFGLLTHH